MNNIISANEAAEVAEKQVSDIKQSIQEEYLSQVAQHIKKAASKGLFSVSVTTIADIPLSQASVDLLRSKGYEVTRSKSIIYKGEYDYTISW